jgi:predicted RNA binding protein YcfA (HicA-like mRNA interferase family)
MRKLPRDLSGAALIKRLEVFGYQVSRQTGSHVRLSKASYPPHHVTIPKHGPLRIGTLSNILSDIARHAGMPKHQLIERLFD